MEQRQAVAEERGSLGGRRDASTQPVVGCKHTQNYMKATLRTRAPAHALFAIPQYRTDTKSKLVKAKSYTFATHT